MDGPDGANEEGGHGVARTQSLGAESTARSMASGPRGVAFARSPQQSQSATLCIGEIETELHQNFAAARRPPQYVFAVEATRNGGGGNKSSGEEAGVAVATNRYFQALSEHCDAGSLQYACLPLVLYGPPGVGKSAILSNWLAQQRALREDVGLPRTAPGAAVISSRRMTCLARRDFVFWHAAGCSRMSCLTAHLLRRVQTELRAFFELKKEVAADDERLRWDLPVFLELAARKGSVLIVIDGVHRMRDEDGGEDLKWLPVTLPPYVRLIVSTTVYGSEAIKAKPVLSPSLQDREDEGPTLSASLSEEEAAQQASLRSNSILVGSCRDPRRACTNKALYELKRRGWEMLEVKEMSSAMCQHVLLSFGGAEPVSSLAYTPASTVAADSSPDSSSSSFSSPPPSPPTLRLFPSQYQAILASPATRNPLFLRLLLQALRWSATQHFDLWRLLPLWLEARSAVELYNRVLETWERGQSVSPTTRAEALKQAQCEGGDHALQWECRQQPRMQPSGSSATSPSQHPPAALDDEAAAAAAAAAAGQSQQQAKDVGADLPLAEIQWRKVHADADKAIENARAAVEQASARAMAKGLEAAAGAERPSDPASSNGTGALTATATGPQPLVEAEEPTSSGMSDDRRSSDTSAYVLEPSSSSAISMIPEEGDWASIPQALRGGEEQEGVGNLLGHALAALYVARHGLTVTELVHLLTALREKEDRRICLRLWERREALLAAFDDADAAGEEAVPVAACTSILQRHGIDVKPHDLARLLTASCAWVAGDDRRVRYRALLEHCTSEQQQQQQQQQASSSMDTADGPMRISVPAKPQLSDAASGKNDPPEPRRSTPHPQGRGTEAALLQMLVALGVLQLHGEDVLVLPLEAEALREAIRVRYIDACGGGLCSAAKEKLWHRAIIHYFQSQSSGLLRRCEELPWHLQVCQHWLALRDFLVDLRAFRCMYSGRLKQELFEYWRLLTEGPLVLPGVAAVELGLLDAAPALQDPMEPSAGVTTSPPVPTGQTAPSLSASPPRCRGGRMAPFDIVECYNTSVEEWRESRAKPSVKQVAEVLWLIAKFLAEFADVGKFQVTLPRYLRKPLHPELMEMMALGPPGAGAGAGRAAAAGPDVVVAASDGLPVGIDRASFRSKLFLVPATPHYQSASDGDKSEDEDGDDASSTSSVSVSKAVRAAEEEGEDEEDDDDEEEERQRREQEEAKSLQQFNSALIAHDTTHYYLKRWVWVQFPWLVMANTSLALQLFLGKLEDESASGPVTAAASFSSSLSSSSSAPLPGRRFPRSRSTSADGPFRRLWAARKVDPARVACASAADTHVLHTMVKSSMLHIAPHAETAGRLTHTICAKDRLLLSKDSEQEAGPGTATIRIPGGVETTGDDEGVAHTLLPAPGLPMTLLEKRLAESNQRVARLRSVLDRVVEDRALMAAQLERLERAAAARDQHDRAILEDIKAGELMMEALAQRLWRVQDANTEVAALTAYYKVVIAQCLEKNPVKDTKRVESVERQVALASFQLRSLVHQRDRVAGEQVAFEEEIPKAQTQLEQIRQERVRVKERLALFRRRALPGSSSISSGGSGNSQALMSMLTTTTLFLKGVLPPHSYTPKEHPGTQPAAARGGTSPLPSSSSNGVLRVEHGGEHSGSSSGSNGTSAPPKLTPYQAVFAASRAQRLCAGMERLFELSHVDVNRGQHDDGDGASRCALAEAAGKIVHTFKNMQKLNHSLLEECRELEARIAELRGALLAQERKAAASSIDRRLLVETGNSDGESSGAMEQQLPHREPGELEALIQEEEERCGRFHAMSTTVNEMLDQVKTGINHLARLVAQHSKALPLASLRCNDGQHEDKYDDADVYKVLSTFDERIASIQEIVVLEANEMADGAIKKFATTAAAAAAAGGGGGKPRDHNGIDMDFLPLLDESSPSQTAASNRRLGVALGGTDGKAGAIMDVDPEELVGIDSDVVLFFKGEAYSRERNAHFSYAKPPEESGGNGDGAYSGTWGSTNPLLRPTAKAQAPRALKMAAMAGSREQVRVKALASAEQAYEESLRAVRRRDDAIFEALEKEEEQQQVQVESTGETEGLLRSALFLDSPSHLQLRQLLKQEHDVDSRQYPHINEGHGIAITKALEKTEIEVSVRALYGWEEREGKAGRGGAGRGGGAASTSGGVAKLGRGAGEREEGSTRARARQPMGKTKPALAPAALVGKDCARTVSKGSK